MTATQHCPECGAPLAGDAPAGLCARCLLAKALSASPPGASPGSPHAAVPSAEELAKQFSELEVRELIGRGGMGAVYRAWQESLHREVALKILPLDLLADEEFLDRFQREARLMAQLDHPHIARVFDTGITDAGWPYLVMELIAGQPITRFCAEHRLGLRARIDLFLQVCDAVQYAHQKGIIHRDLKPSNVLVAAQSGAPVPKVIDFGLARPVGDPGADDAIWRSQTHAVGTPAYMSPEQAGGAEVDTRTDVYALGVLLYELLTGVTPFDDAQLRGGSRTLIQKIIRETPTPKPSERIVELERGLRRLDEESPTAQSFSSSSSETAGRIEDEDEDEKEDEEEQQARLSKKPALPDARQLRGDLDAIVLKAVAKHATERYPTVAAFTEDLARHLRFEPVATMPGTAAYRAGKFFRRNRASVSLATLVLVGLLGGYGSSLWQGHQARLARDDARTAQARAERINQFLTAMLEAPDPTKDGREVRVIDLLATAAKRAETELAAEPAVLAEVLRTMGFTYYQLTLYAAAEPLLKRALELQLQVFGEDSPATARGYADLGNLFTWTSRFDDAVRELRKSVEIFHRLPGHERDLANALGSLGGAYLHAGRDREAEPWFQECLDLSRRLLGPTNTIAANALNELAHIRGNVGDDPGYRQLLRESIAMKRQFPEARMDLAASLANLGQSLASSGEFAEAEAVFNESLAIRRELFGEASSEVANVMVKLGGLRLRQERFADAAALARAALEIQTKTLPEGHRDFANSLGLLGRARPRGRFPCARRWKSASGFSRRTTGRRRTWKANLANASPLNGDLPTPSRCFCAVTPVCSPKWGRDPI